MGQQQPAGDQAFKPGIEYICKQVSIYVSMCVCVCKYIRKCECALINKVQSVESGEVFQCTTDRCTHTDTYISTYVSGYVS